MVQGELWRIVKDKLLIMVILILLPIEGNQEAIYVVLHTRVVLLVGLREVLAPLTQNSCIKYRNHRRVS